MRDVVVDTSALVAIVTGESHGGWVANAFDQTELRILSSASFTELAVVLSHKFGPMGPTAADHIVNSLAIEVAPLTPDEARLAASAYVRFGRGRHPASLNYGDSFVYGLASNRGLPVLCLGNDFPQTDLETINPD